MTSLSTSSTHQLSSPSLSPGMNSKQVRKQPPMKPELVSCGTSSPVRKHHSESSIRISSQEFGAYIPVYKDSDPFVHRNVHQRGGTHHDVNGQRSCAQQSRGFSPQWRLSGKGSKYNHDAGPYVPVHSEPPTFIPVPDYTKPLTSSIQNEIEVIESAFDGIDAGKKAFF